MEANVEFKSLTIQVVSAILFAVTSFAITIINRIILSVYMLPSYQVLGLGQMLATITVLWLGSCAHLIALPPLERRLLRRIWPLSLLYLCNLWTGLDGTQQLNLPMFTALSCISVLMTMVFEAVVLGVKSSFSVQASVVAMIGGAMIAAADDVTFSWTGYSLVLINDVLSAANGVYLKRILNSKDLDVNGLLFYNSLFMFIAGLMFALGNGDFYRCAAFPLLYNSLFLSFFLLSCFLGILMSYCVVMCTKYNSALTTAIIESTKSIFITYFGIFYMDDYQFSLLNFVGFNIGVVGCITYTFSTLKQPTAKAIINSVKVDSLINLGSAKILSPTQN